LQRVAVIGGGLAGLTAARGLRVFGKDLDVYLYEKRSSPLLQVDQGIGIWPEAQENLEDLKIKIPEYKEIRPAYYTSKRGFILSRLSDFEPTYVHTMSQQQLVQNFYDTLDEGIIFFSPPKSF
jgi:2-polyprenyl-6-methoxyphenol hydroxylase-like FAD-dependent oxidoreductase